MASPEVPGARGAGHQVPAGVHGDLPTHGSSGAGGHPSWEINLGQHWGVAGLCPPSLLHHKHQISLLAPFRLLVSSGCPEQPRPQIQENSSLSINKRCSQKCSSLGAAWSIGPGSHRGRLGPQVCRGEGAAFSPSPNASGKAQKSPKSGWGQTSERIPAVTAPLQQQQSPKTPPHAQELRIPVPVICWIRVRLELPHGGTVLASNQGPPPLIHHALGSCCFGSQQEGHTNQPESLEQVLPP